MKKAAISPAQQKVLDALALHGALERRRSGHWTAAGVAETQRGVPEWYVNPNALYALLGRRLVLVTDRTRLGEPCLVALAPAARVTL
ncbi:MAG: hypothetical protein HQL38_03150 [Alphaproteobacteria bacterium]|nr:hypothetical protein [Alphaproteobacteria bacterium]